MTNGAHQRAERQALGGRIKPSGANEANRRPGGSERLAAIVAGFSFRAGLGTPTEQFREKAVYAPNGVVSTSQPLASQAGLAVLQRGGNDVVVRTADDAKSVAGIALQRDISIPPTVKVAQGTAIRIFIARDLDFSGTDGGS